MTRFWTGWFVLLSCLLALTGCKRFPNEMISEAALKALPQSRGCSGYQSEFGKREDLEKDLVTFVQPKGFIEIQNDGGWCWASLRYTSNGKASVPGMRVETPPRSGKVLLGGVDGKIYIAYRPNENFAGMDRFVVLLDTAENWRIPVDVEVSR